MASYERFDDGAEPASLQLPNSQTAANADVEDNQVRIEMPGQGASGGAQEYISDPAGNPYQAGTPIEWVLFSDLS